MIMQFSMRRCLLAGLLAAGWLSCQRAALALPVTSSSATAAPTNNNPVLNLNRLSGVFTVTGFQVVNGVGEATGVFNAQASDAAGFSVDLITNVPIRVPVPVNGALSGKVTSLTKLSKEFVPPPELSTNLCTILGVSIAFVDLVVPGLGLNVHLNQLLLVARADRETTLGDVLCTLLGEDAFGNNNGPNASLKLMKEGTNVLVEGKGPGTLQATPTLKQPVPWTNVLTVTPSQFFRVAPTGAVHFFRLTPQ